MNILEEHLRGTSLMNIIDEHLNPICHGLLGPDRFMGGHKVPTFNLRALNCCLTFKFCVCIESYVQLAKIKKIKKSQHGCGRWAPQPHLTPPCSDFACSGLKDIWFKLKTTRTNRGGRTKSTNKKCDMTSCTGHTSHTYTQKFL